MKDLRLQGYAAALADLSRLHDIPVEIADALDEAGLDLAALRKAGVDQNDIQQLQKILRDVR